MDATLLNAMINHINVEIYSSYLYLAMAADATDKGYPGFSHWFMVQSQEELSHAMKIYTYLVERGEKVTFGAIEAPPTTWDSLTAIFEETLEHEKSISARIRDLFKTARDIFDPATEIFLNWFIMEQVEEETNVVDILQKLQLAQDAHGGLLQLDRELSQRAHLYTLNRPAE